MKDAAMLPDGELPHPPQNEQLDLGELFSDRTLVTNAAAGLSTEPDGTFVTWASYEAGRVRLVPRKDRPGQYKELEGTPDWVLEVVSRSSVLKDTVSLRESYHRARIPEYWLIDARPDPLVFDILRHTPKGYRATPKKEGWVKSAVFGKSFRLTCGLSDLRHPEYTLETR